MRTSKGLEFNILDSGVAVVSGIGYCENEYITVPEKIEGFSVVGVAEKAFCKSLQIKSITLPDSVKYIDDEAFAWCHELKSIKFEGILEIGERAFMGCDKLSEMSFGNELEVIGEKAFAYCPSIIAVELPDSVSFLGSSSFEGCRSLKSVSIPDSVKTIEYGTFYACSSLRQVKLPKRLEYIDEYAFAHCTSITEMALPSKTVLNADAFFQCGTLHRKGYVS